MTFTENTLTIYFNVIKVYKVAESTNIALYLKTWVILCQINQILKTSPTQFFHFVNIFFWRKPKYHV